MDEWGIALVAAGSAIAGGFVTGWFTRTAGYRQADAARHAGDRQADALLDTVRMTLDEQRSVRLLDLRRQTYLRFLEAAEAALLARRTGEGGSDGRTGLGQALAAVVLEGPEPVVSAARNLAGLVRRSAAPDDLEQAKLAFVDIARGTLGTAPDETAG
jgi:hypothetical protein